MKTPFVRPYKNNRNILNGYVFISENWLLGELWEIRTIYICFIKKHFSHSWLLVCINSSSEMSVSILMAFTTSLLKKIIGYKYIKTYISANNVFFFYERYKCFCNALK